MKESITDSRDSGLESPSFQKFQEYTRKKYPDIYAEGVTKEKMNKDDYALHYVTSFTNSIQDLTRDIFLYTMSSYLLQKGLIDKEELDYRLHQTKEVKQLR